MPEAPDRPTPRQVTQRAILADGGPLDQVLATTAGRAADGILPQRWTLADEARAVQPGREEER